MKPDGKTACELKKAPHDFCGAFVSVVIELVNYSKVNSKPPAGEVPQ